MHWCRLHRRYLITPSLLFYDFRYSNAMSTHVCHVILSDFVEKSGFESCFWSAQCTEILAGTFDKIKTWVFSSLKVQSRSFIDNVLHCNTLCPIKATFLEVEKTMFTVATLVPMFTIITLVLAVYNQRLFMLIVAWRYIVRENVLDNQKLMYECYRFQSNSQTYIPQSWYVNIFFKYWMFSMTIVSLTCLINWVREIFLVVFDWRTTKTQLCVTAWRFSSTFAAKSHSSNKKWFEGTATESAWL